MKTALIALFVVAVIVAASGKLIAAYNQLTTEKHDIDARWSQIDKDMDAELRLLPAVLRSGHGFAAREETALQQIDYARRVMINARNKQEKMEADNRLSAAVDRFLLIENTTSDTWADARKRLADDRQNYNEALQTYNADRELSPRNMVAAVCHLGRDDEYFKGPDDTSTGKER